MTVLLIDADIIAYRAAAVSQKTFVWDEEEPLTTSVILADKEELYAAIQYSVFSVLDKFDSSAIPMMCFSSKTNFRKKVDATYKHNRANTVRPQYLQEAREHIINIYGGIAYEHLEGDDVMGILATGVIQDETIMVSWDKDMKGVPGYLYNPANEMLVLSSEEEADYYHMLQTLTGDTADGYPGCPKIGEVKGRKILGELTGYDRWKAVVEAYESKGLTKHDALRQAWLARILRSENYDFEKHKINMWKPPRKPK